MAKKAQVTVPISAKNQLKAGLEDATKELGKFGKVVEHLGKLTIGAGIGLALKKIGDSAKYCIDEFAKIEPVQRKLTAALGQNTQAYAKAQNTIAKYSKQTLQAGDDVTALVAKLAQLGKSANEIDDITHACVALSNVTGNDLNSSLGNLLDSLNGEVGELKKFVPELANMSKEALKAGNGIQYVIDKFGKLSEEVSGDSFAQTKKNISDSWSTISQSIGEILTNDLSEVFDWAEKKSEELAGYFSQWAQDSRDAANGNINKNSNARVFYKGIIRDGNTDKLKDWSKDDLLSILIRYRNEYDKESRNVNPDMDLLWDYEKAFKVIGSELKSRGIFTTVEDALNSLGDKINNSSKYVEDIVDAFKYVPKEDIEKAQGQYYGNQQGLLSPHIAVWTDLEEGLYKEWGNKLSTLFIAGASKASEVVLDPMEEMDAYFEEVDKKIKSHSGEIDTFFEHLTELFSKNEINFADPEVTKATEDLGKLNTWLASLGAAGTLSGIATRGNAFQSWINDLMDPKLEPAKLPNSSFDIKSNLQFQPAPSDLFGMRTLNFKMPQPIESRNYWDVLDDINDTVKTFSTYLNPKTNEEKLKAYRDQAIAVEKQRQELISYAAYNKDEEEKLLTIIKGIEEKCNDIEETMEKEAYDEKASIFQDSRKNFELFWRGLFTDDKALKDQDGKYLYNDEGQVRMEDSGWWKEHWDNLWTDVADKFAFLYKADPWIELWDMIWDRNDAIIQQWESVNSEESIHGSLQDKLEKDALDLAQAFQPLMAFLKDPIFAAMVEIFHGFAEALAPVVNDIIRPLMESLHQLGAAFASIVAPIMELLKPAFMIIGDIIVRVAAVFQWVGDHIHWAIQSLLNWMAGLNLFGWKPFKGLARENPEPEHDIVKYVDNKVEKFHDSMKNPEYGGSSTQTAVQNASYTGSTNITLNIYQNGNICGDNGIQEFAIMIKDALATSAYYGD